MEEYKRQENVFIFIHINPGKLTKYAVDCPEFGAACTPQSPLGATMVSAEGACAAYYAYGRHLDPRVQIEGRTASG